MEFLRAKPPCNYSQDFTYLETLGFLHEYPTYLPRAASNDGSVLNPVYLKFDPKLERVPVPLTHGYIRTTWQSVGKQFALFDHPPTISDFPESCFEWACSQVITLFEILGIRSRVLAPEQVDWNLQSASGFGRKQTGYPTKLDFLTKNVEEVNSFWENAHMMKTLFMLWKVAGKEEYLPLEKIKSGDQRCFEIPDVLLLSYALRLCQSFNKQLYAHFEDTPIKVGIGFQHGGFHKFIRDLEATCQIFDTSDVRKWDKSYSRRIRVYCQRIRVALYVPDIGMSKDEFALRLNMCYEQSLNPFCVLPWKQIVRIPFGYMMSGDWNTTPDNSIGHLLVRLAYLKFHLPRLRTYHDAFTVHKPNLYADDSLNGWKNDATGNFLSSFKTRSEFYQRCGLMLKKEDDRVSTSVIDLTFLGATVAKDGSEYVPVYNLSSIWSRIVRLQSKKINPRSLYQKMVSLLMLSTFNGEAAFERIREVTLFTVSFLDKEFGYGWNSEEVEVLDSDYFVALDGAVMVPTYSWCVGFWKGWESGPDRPLGLDGRVKYTQMSKITSKEQAALAIAKKIVEKVETAGNGNGKKKRRNNNNKKKEEKSLAREENRILATSGPRKEAALYANNSSASVKTNVGKGFHNGKRENRPKREVGGRSKPLARGVERIFFHEMMTPDVTGPFRVPRVGGAVKTGLAMDITHYTITGSGTNLIQGFAGRTSPNTNCGYSLTSVAAGTDFTQGNVAFSSQYPLLSTYADSVVITAMSVVAYYSGAPFSVAGEVLIGNYDTRETLTGVDYNDVWNYPGVTRMPIADLIDQPMRVSLLKESPDNEIFIAPSASGWSSLLAPIIVTSNLPANQTIEIQVVRTWEFISNLAAGNLVPYAVTGNSFTKELDAYQDATNMLGRIGSAVSSVMTHPLTQGLLSMAAKSLPFMLSSKNKATAVKMAHEWRLKEHMKNLQIYHGIPFVPIKLLTSEKSDVEGEAEKPPPSRSIPPQDVSSLEDSEFVRELLARRLSERSLSLNNRVKT